MPQKTVEDAGQAAAEVVPYATTKGVIGRIAIIVEVDGEVCFVSLNQTIAGGEESRRSDV